MVPVKLSLSNFLSYGSESQTLEFDRFHVACLSGKNGQGKSALLDALTWALWGEARKSSGAQKPDEELLRIGSRRMVVDLVFDVEKERYRVLRTYSKSASGKTSKSSLEFQLLNINEDDEGIPLTKTSIRDTQELINERLGLDYDAFVNSALLLQGRSDEFTKKKPSERKNILGRVLNLGRYDKLADRARQYQYDLRLESERLQREMEIYSSLLENEKAWKAEFAELQSKLKEEEGLFSLLGETESDLLKKLNALQSKQKESEVILELIQKSAAQKATRLQEKQVLINKIQKANDLIEQKDNLLSQYNAFLELQIERDNLETERELYRGIEKQLHAAEATLALEKKDYNAAIDRARLELQSKEQNYAELKQHVETKELLFQKLEKAKLAKKNLDELQESFKKKALLANQVRDLEQKIVNETKLLENTLDGYRRQRKGYSQKIESNETLNKQIIALSREIEELDKVKSAKEEVTETGQLIAGEIVQLDAQLVALKTDKEKLEKRAHQLSESNTSVCPTCGSILLEDQRAKIIAGLKDDLEKIALAEKDLSTLLQDKSNRRQSLREEYRNLLEREASLNESYSKHIQLKERLARNTELRGEYEVLLDKENSIALKLENNDFAVEERVHLKEASNALDQYSVTQDDLDRLSFDAAQAPRYQDRIREVMFSEGKLEGMERQIDQLKKSLTQLRVNIDNGSAFENTRRSIDDLRNKLSACAFQPDRFEELKRKINDQKGLPVKMKELADSEENMSEWVAERERLDQIIEDLNKEAESNQEKSEELSAELLNLPVREKEYQEKVQERELSGQKLKELRQNFGDVNARLQQLADAKLQKTTARASLKEVSENLNVYRKLKTAFWEKWNSIVNY